MRKMWVLISCIVWGSISLTGYADVILTHSYTFDDYSSDGSYDTVKNNVTGTYDATLHTAGTGTYDTTVSGSLKLTGGDSNNGAYALLPENLVVAGQSSVTIETWASVQDIQKWSRFFDIGINDQSKRLFLTTGNDANGNAHTRFQLDSNGTGTYKISTETLYNLTVSKTWDAASQTGTLSFYVNGNLVSMKADSNTATDLLADDSESKGITNYLGKSGWTDSYGSKTINEFNVYNGEMGPTVARLRASEGMGTARTLNSSTYEAAAKIDNLICSAAGYWDGTSQSTINLTGGDWLVNSNMVFETNYDASLFGTLTSNGITLRDGLNNVNGFAWTKASSIITNPSDKTFSTRIKMDTFETSNGVDTVYFMRTHNGNDIRFGLGTINGTADTGTLVIYAANNQYGLYQADPESGYVLELYDTAHADSYFNLSSDRWYDVTGTYTVTGDDTGDLSLLVYDPTTGFQIVSETTETTFGTLGDSSEFLIFEAPRNGSGTAYGVMDYAGVWNSALTGDQAALLSFSTPEPSSLLLLLTGLSLFAVLWSRKRGVRRTSSVQ